MDGNAAYYVTSFFESRCPRRLLLGLTLTGTLTLFQPGFLSAQVESKPLSATSPENDADPSMLPAAKSSQPKLPPLAQPIAAPNQQTIEDIKAIRARLGGGVAAQLGDLLEQPNGLKNVTEEFDQELWRLVQSPAGPTATSPTPSIPAPDPLIEASSQDSISPAFHFPSPMVNQSRLALRRAARNIELAAADLEIAGKYDRADQLRATAATLWKQARREVTLKDRHRP